MANDVQTADEKRANSEAAIDAAVRTRLTCPGCRGPYLPVPHKNYVAWCCPRPGCSKMIGPATIEGLVAAIVQAEGLAGLGSPGAKAEAALRRYVRSLKKRG